MLLHKLQPTVTWGKKIPQNLAEFVGLLRKERKQDTNTACALYFFTKDNVSRSTTT